MRIYGAIRGATALAVLATLCSSFACTYTLVAVQAIQVKPSSRSTSWGSWVWSAPAAAEAEPEYEVHAEPEYEAHPLQLRWSVSGFWVWSAPAAAEPEPSSLLELDLATATESDTETDSSSLASAPAPAAAAPAPAPGPAMLGKVTIITPDILKYFPTYVHSYERGFGSPFANGGGLKLEPNADGQLEFKFPTKLTWDETNYAWQAPAPAPGPAAPESKDEKEEEKPWEAPAPAPAKKADDSCMQLAEMARKDFPLNFGECRAYSYYGALIDAFKRDSDGCYCSAWGVNCPYETCKGSAAINTCLSSKAKKLGFGRYSKHNSSLKMGIAHHVSPMTSGCLYLKSEKPPHAITVMQLVDES